jgi:Arc/MetJ-type ribon-helix-helix transcriptional regulator
VNTKQRLSASVDADLIAAAEDAVARGRVVSVSAWVNDALRAKVAHDKRLEALAAFVAEFEREHGLIAPEEMDAAARRARGRATPVRAARAGRMARAARASAAGRRRAG